MLWKALLKHWQNKGQSLFVQILDAKPNWTSKKTNPNTLLLRSLIITFFLIIFFLFRSSVIFTSSICVRSKKGIKYNPLCTKDGSQRIFFEIAFLLRTGSKYRKYRKNNEFEIVWISRFSQNQRHFLIVIREFSRIPWIFPSGSSFFFSG